MDMKLAGNVVVVTGGAKGIGEAIVRELAAEGAIPVIVDRDEAAGSQLREEVSTGDRRCEFVLSDLVERGACQAAIAEVAQKVGRVDALVNNAGVNDNVGVMDGDADEFVVSLRRSLVHYFEMVHFAIPFLKKSQGAVVNVSSKVALTGQGGTSGYAAAKGGILALTREWAVDLHTYGVRVNAVVPGDVMTPLYRQWLDTFPDPKAKLDGIIQNIPLETRMTKAEEVASGVAFLLSPRSGHITGQQLVIDGGYVHLDRSIT